MLVVRAFGAEGLPSSGKGYVKDVVLNKEDAVAILVLLPLINAPMVTDARKIRPPCEWIQCLASFRQWQEENGESKTWYI